MKYILTSCGLSLLTNYLKEFKIYPNEVYKYSNLPKQEIDSNFLNKIMPHIENLKNEILNYNIDELKKSAAELNALLRFYKEKFDKKDIHCLFYTDTYLGELTAEIIKTYLESKNLTISMYKAKDLKTNDLESFRLALSDAVKELSEQIIGYKKSNYEIVFNLTGGFKSVNSFLQSMATIYADKSIYVFETSDELLTIPSLPLKIDESVFIENTNIFRAMENNLPYNISDVELIPQTLIIKIGNEYFISEWGEIVWQKFKNEYYGKNLINPILNISYSEEFTKNFKSLSSNEKLQLNKSIDKLERYLHKGENLSSLRYHPLVGEISKKYSNEFYPFDGNDSRRVYCNENNGSIVLEKIDGHLK